MSFRESSENSSSWLSEIVSSPQTCWKMKSPSALSLLLVSLSCLLAPFNAKSTEDSKCDRSVDLAIIGAGAAGAYSAYKLRDANMSIELLEYSDRVGGRMFSMLMPDSPDVIIELGIMKYPEKMNSRIEKLAAELNLTPEDFLEGRPEKKKYFLRGQTITRDQIESGTLPFNLSLKEKENQARLVEYYLQELTGFNESSLSYEEALKLRVEDGRLLHKLSLEEALDMVATEEGKELVRGLGKFDGVWAKKASATAFFRSVLGDEAKAKERTLKEGMSKLPQRLVEKFSEASTKNKLTLNRKLERAEKLEKEKGFKLDLVKTKTEEGRTFETWEEESICAKKVILAVPQRALLELKYEPFRTGRVRDALYSMISVKTSKVFMSFRESSENSSSWLSEEEPRTHVWKSDTPIGQALKWKYCHSSKQHIVLASYTSMHKAEFLEALNSEGAPYLRSSSRPYEASNIVVQEVLSHLSEALSVSKSEINSPTKVVAKFWSEYPSSGCSTVLKAGYNPEDIRQTIQQPVLGEELYIVGSDFALFESHTTGAETALATVDNVISKYSIDS